MVLLKLISGERAHILLERAFSNIRLILDTMIYINTNKLKNLQSPSTSCQKYQGIIVLFLLIYRSSSSKQNSTQGDDKQIENNYLQLQLKQNKIKFKCNLKKNMLELVTIQIGKFVRNNQNDSKFYWTEILAFY